MRVAIPTRNDENRATRVATGTPFHINKTRAVAAVALKSYPNCFGCGSDNPIGLKLVYRLEGENVVTDFVPQEEHQGWPGITHGGIITSLLYEVMENYPYQKGIVAVMRGMETRFRKPINTGQAIIAKSWLVEESGRAMKVAGSLMNQDDLLLAQGEADLLVLNEDQMKSLGIT